MLLVIPEMIGLPLFFHAVGALFRAGCLKGAIVDEVHMTCTSYGYRECMKNVRLVSSGAKKCPLVLLSSTVQPNLVSNVLEVCGEGENNWVHSERQ